ncbi:type VI secretion system baseplate subunit TssF [Algibacter sp. L3A6]|uniref:type VI secretion system baseplate subunit TssF n=1 Tax=Algibacter sp. L3A6 TaxID=2686366 RepID=UPI00131CA02A|nr:type VI secretion system baseplate subunit TssF [Algibacter sp. L3A6]
MSYTTKEDIKNRMMKKAASLWNIPANEIADSFDPIISLLLSACASELEKLSGDISDSHIRVTERLIQLMTPLSTFDVKPAHTIAYCESLEPKTIITAEHQLYYKKKTTSQRLAQGYKDIFFTPTQNTKLLDARVKHIVTGNKLFTFSDKKSKDLAQMLGNEFDLEAGTLYIGLESEHKNLDLNDVSFYFEYMGVANKDLFYHHLSNATWYLGDQKINTIDGYYNSEELDRITLENILDGNTSKASTLCGEINKYYQKHFVTLKLPNKVEDFPDYPELQNFKNPKNDAFLGSDLLWLKVEFSSIISSKALEQLYCSINAFPVLNRKWNNISYKMKDFIDIIPILSEDPFFDVKSIENANGKTYKLEAENVDEVYKGTYFLRSANVGKLDSRKAKEYIVHLLELLRDESAAFKFFNHEFLQNNLNTLNQTIALIEKKANEVVDSSLHTNYVYLNPFTSSENINVTYWTTNGEEANHIKARKSLEIYKGPNLKTKSSYFLRPVFGGSNSLTMEQRIEAYRRVTLTKNRIVTEEDLKAVCYELYGKNIKHIEVKKGFMTDLSITKGILQCIEIILIPSENGNLKPYEWDYLNENLLSILKKQAVNIFPYKIVIKEL